MPRDARAYLWQAREAASIVDHEILWRVIHESLPGLRETLDRLIE